MLASLNIGLLNDGFALSTSPRAPDTEGSYDLRTHRCFGDWRWISGHLAISPTWMVSLHLGVCVLSSLSPAPHLVSSLLDSLPGKSDIPIRLCLAIIHLAYQPRGHSSSSWIHRPSAASTWGQQHLAPSTSPSTSTIFFTRHLLPSYLPLSILLLSVSTFLPWDPSMRVRRADVPIISRHIPLAGM